MLMHLWSGAGNDMHLYLLARQAHRGFLRAFNSITNVTDPRSNIAAAWTAMTGVPAASVTKCDSCCTITACMLSLLFTQQCTACMMAPTAMMVLVGVDAGCCAAASASGRPWQRCAHLGLRPPSPT
jgi:hypothetical protein